MAESACLHRAPALAMLLKDGRESPLALAKRDRPSPALATQPAAPSAQRAGTMAAAAALEVANAHARIERILSGAGIEGEAGEPVSTKQSDFFCSHLDYALKVSPPTPPAAGFPASLRGVARGRTACGSDRACSLTCCVSVRVVAFRALAVGDSVVAPASGGQGACAPRHARGRLRGAARV